MRSSRVLFQTQYREAVSPAALTTGGYATRLACVISRCSTGRTCECSSVATATVSPSSATNSTSNAFPSRYICTTVPTSPVASLSAGRSTVSTTRSCSLMTVMFDPTSVAHSVRGSCNARDRVRNANFPQSFGKLLPFAHCESEAHEKLSFASSVRMRHGKQVVSNLPRINVRSIPISGSIIMARGLALFQNSYPIAFQ